MNIHNNARLTPKGRELLVQRIVVDGLRPREAAQAAGVSPQYIVFPFFVWSGTFCMESQCSTIFPSASKRKKSIVTY